MSWLLWKDYRLNRALFVFIGAMVIGPYAIGLMIYLVDAWNPPVETSLLDIVLGANASGLVTSLLSVSLLAGNAIASERVDRASEFLASLPISRARILTSKILVVLTIIAAIAGLQLTVFYMLTPGTDGAQYRPNEAPNPFVGLAFASVLTLGVGWAASAVLDSPTYSIVSSIFALLCLFFVIALLAEFGVVTNDDLYWASLTACLVIGLPSFIGGWWYYLRRVEP